MPTSYLRGCFIVGSCRGICHGLPGIGDCPAEALAVGLLGPAPLDLRHIRGLHDGLLTVCKAVRPISHLPAHAPNARIKEYFDHVYLCFLVVVNRCTNLPWILKQSCIHPILPDYCRSISAVRRF